jgi:hypothetical protein
MQERQVADAGCLKTYDWFRGVNLQRRCRKFLQTNLLELQVPDMISLILWHRNRLVGIPICGAILKQLRGNNNDGL